MSVARPLERLVSVAFLGTCLGGCRASRHADGHAPVSAISAEPGSPAPVLPTPAWQAGSVYTYHFTLGSVTELAPGSSVRARFGGNVSVAARAVGQGTEVALRVSDAQGTTTDAQGREEPAEVAKHLDQPFAFVLEGGVITKLRIAKACEPNACNLLRTLASAFQLAQPQAGATWQATEYDSTGRYIAEYSAVGPSVEKHKLRYESLTYALSNDRMGTVMPVPRVTESAATLRVNASTGVLGGVHSQESLAFALGPSSIVSKASLDLTLSTTRSEKVDFAALEAATRELAPEESYARSAPDEDVFDRQRIGNYTFATALAELEQVARPDRSNLDAEDDDAQRDLVRRTQKAFMALAAILRSQPAQLPAARAAVLRRSKAGGAVGDALAGADTTESLATLVALCERSDLPDPLRLSLLQSLMRAERPSEREVAFFQAHLHDPKLAFAAALGLGSAVRHLHDIDPARASSAATPLLQLLGAAQSDSARVVALGGISNSGYDPAFDVIKPFLVDRDPTVRAAAVDSIRLMKRVEVDDVIAAACADSAPEVRGAALGAASARAPSDSVAKALERILASEPNSSLRGRALRVAGHWLPAREQMRQVIERVAASDSNEKLRQQAEELLAKKSG